MVHFEDVGEGWVFFKYEKLPIFCYRCDILSHQDRECKKITKGCPSLDDDGFQFGPWLCALAPKINHKKIGFQQSRSRDDDFDDCTATRDDEFDKHSSGQKN